MQASFPRFAAVDVFRHNFGGMALIPNAMGLGLSGC